MPCGKQSQLLSRCLEDKGSSSDHTGEAHTGLDVGGGTSVHGHLGGGGSVLGHAGGAGTGGSSGAVLAVADSDGLGVDVASRVGEGKSLGVDSRASGLSSAGSANLNNNGGTGGLGASVNSGGNRDHGTAGGRVDSGGGGSVRAAVAGNRSSGDDGGSGADVDGLRDGNDLCYNSAAVVLERAVGHGRSARSDGDDVGRVDGRSCKAASRDGGCTVAVASSIAIAVGDTLGELDTLSRVGSLNIAVESASTSDSVECGTNTGAGSVTEVQAVVKAGGNSTSGEGEVASDIDNDSKVVCTFGALVEQGLDYVVRKNLLALDLVGEARVVDVERKVETRAELAVKSRDGRVGTTNGSGGVGARTASTRAGGGGDGTARGSGGGGSGVTEVVLRDGGSHAREGQDGSGGDGTEGRHFDFWLVVVGY